MNSYIRICDIEKYYGNASHVTKAVDRLSFTVDRGEFVGVMGASGSGKTTLLNLLATIDRVSAGHIFYGDTDITALSEDALSEFRKNNLGFVFQEYNLLDTLTIEENISGADAAGQRQKAGAGSNRKALKTSGYRGGAGQIPLPDLRRSETALRLRQSVSQRSETPAGR